MGVQQKKSHVQPSTLPSGQDDRRSVCRYTVVLDQCWLGWWDGATFITTAGRIVDLSLRGALLEVEALPATEQSVWLCPPGTSTPEWLEARLVQSKKKLLGPRHVRIAFLRIFPYEYFKALVYGSGSSSPRQVPEKAEEEQFEPEEW